MKKLLLFIWVITINSYLFAWDDPVYLTDSLANNYEPVISYVNFYEGESHYMFWVRETDSAYNAIYARNMYSESEPVLVTELDTCTFRNPRIIPFSYNTGILVDFIILYESNESGVFNIYYKIYDTGSLSEPYLLEGSDNNQSHLQCNGYNGELVWEENGEIHYTEIQPELYFSESIILDEGNCYEPVITVTPDWSFEYYISWVKQDTINEVTEIYYMKREYWSTWGEKTLLHESSDIKNIQFANIDLVGYPTGFLFWDNIDLNDVSTIYGYDFESEEYFISEFSKEGVFKPTAFNTIITVKTYWSEAYLAFEYSEDTTTSIYINNMDYLSPSPEDYWQISNPYTMDKNPIYYLGANQEWYCRDLFLLWESTYENNTRIASSKTLICLSVVEENSGTLYDFRLSPNPIKDNVSLSFTTQSSVDTYFELSTINGKSIGNKIEIKTQSGENNLNLSLSDFNANLENGIYLLKIKVDNGFIAKKIIISD